MFFTLQVECPGLFDYFGQSRNSSIAVTDSHEILWASEMILQHAGPLKNQERKKSA